MAEIDVPCRFDDDAALVTTAIHTSLVVTVNVRLWCEKHPDQELVARAVDDHNGQGPAFVVKPCPQCAGGIEGTLRYTRVRPEFTVDWSEYGEPEPPPADREQDRS